MTKYVTLLLFTGLILQACAAVTSEKLNDNAHRLSHPIQMIAMTEPGLNGSRNALTHEASNICPNGWQTLEESIAKAPDGKVMTWVIQCK